MGETTESVEEFVTAAPAVSPESTADISGQLNDLIELQQAINDNIVHASANNDLYLSFITAGIFFIVGALAAWAVLSKVRS